MNNIIWEPLNENILKPSEKIKKYFYELEDHGYSPIASQLLINRNIHTHEQAQYYFDMSLSKLHSPHLLPNIDAAVSRIVRAIKAKEKIFIWGDYDVDGITSTAVVLWSLNAFNANLEWHIPHRIDDGYDIKIHSVEKAIQSNADILLTVDCGILAFEAAEYAASKNIDLIITDHHTPSDSGEIPKCIAVINPKIKGSTYPFTGLAGVGIAFKFMCAIAQEINFPIKELAKNTLELVALGTVADVAPMVDENRILVHHGCKLLNNSQRAGIKSLIKVSRVQKIDSTNIGFSLAPRINAIGRLDNPIKALNLLITDDEDEASMFAQELEAANIKRQKIQKDATHDAEHICTTQHSPSEDRCIVIGSKSWPAGIVGLIAAKLAEKFQVPTLVGHIKPDGFIKGSCRSAQDIDILKCLKSAHCINLFKSKSDGSKILGGHAFAAGFEMHEKDVDTLRKNLGSYIKEQYPDLSFGNQIINYDAQVNVSELNLNSVETIKQFSPFGSGNSSPVFLVKNAVIDTIATISDGKHLKIGLNSVVEGYKGNNINALWWHKGDLIDQYIPGTKVKALIQIDFSAISDRAITVFILDLVEKK